MNHSHQYVSRLQTLWPPDQFQGRMWAAFETYGEEFKAVDWKLSATIAKKHRSQRGRCFDNCRRIALKDTRFKYYEGTAVAIIPIEHAWLVLDGIVVDPTFAILNNFNKDDADYFGVHLTVKELLEPQENMFHPGWLKKIERIVQEESVAVR